MDALINRLARGEVTLADGAPGDPIPLPDNATIVRQADREWPVESGGFFRPPEVGAYYVLAGSDTVGAITANLDPRESLLAPASDDQVRRLWQDARVVDLAEAGGLAFSHRGVGRSARAAALGRAGAGPGRARPGERAEAATLKLKPGPGRVRAVARVDRAGRAPAQPRGSALRLGGLPGSSGSVLVVLALPSIFRSGSSPSWRRPPARRNAGSPISPSSWTRDSRSIPSGRRWARTSRTTRSPASAPRPSRRCCKAGCGSW